jgi:hypothetical protein
VLRSQGWPEGIVALSDFGDGAWSCIDAIASDERILTMDGEGLTRTRFDLHTWLEAWVSGIDINAETFEIVDGSIISPVTRRPMSIKHRGRAKGESVQASSANKLV